MISFTAQAGERDWKQIRSSDTLALFSNGKLAGSMTHTMSVNDSTESITVETVVHVASAGLSAGEISRMELFERRNFGFDGVLKSANQEIKSAAGSNTWSLAGENRGSWTLSVTAGGTTTARTIRNPPDNLGMTYALYAGMKNRAIRAGDLFHDTAMELTSGQTSFTTATCLETPSSKNRHRWVFSTINNITSRNERLELDTNGRTIYQEVWPFVARIKTSGSDTAGAPAPALFETLAIPSERAAGDGESIRLTFDKGRAPDSSVARLYRKSGKSWVVNTVARTCPGKTAALPADTSLRRFTMPTASMQSGDARIIRLADSLAQGRKNRCDSIRACCDWVNRALVKRYSPTFSSALETLQAGFGDCGEHAVLLGALLRAGGIPARVVLGLVYVENRRGYLYHAWVAAHDGNAWVFADPALGVFPAARDRVPLVIDDAGSAALGIAKMLGRIRIDYVEVRNRNGGR
jgi:transglutaminase-like putative cysteine protease